MRAGHAGPIRSSGVLSLFPTLVKPEGGLVARQGQSTSGLGWVSSPPASIPAPGRIFVDAGMEWTCTGEVVEWRGPAPNLFVAMTAEKSEDLREAARGLPVKVAVQRAEAIGEGALVEVVVRLNAAHRE